MVLFFSWRLLRGLQERSISLMVSICFFAILVGTAAFTLVLGIMTGFEVATKSKLQGLHADIIIQAPPGEYVSATAIKEVLKKQQEVIGISPIKTGHAIVITKEELPNPIMMIGIDPIAEGATTTLAQALQHTVPLEVSLEQEQILIGESLARELKIKKGDEVTVLFAPEISEKKCELESRKVIVGNIFKTGIDELDKGVAYVSYKLFDELFPDIGVSSIGVKTRPGTDTNALAKQLKNRLKLPVYPWEHLYPALLSALTLEKYGMGLVLFLLAVLSTINIIAVMFMYISFKRHDIAILRTMGMSFAKIIQIFIMIGMSIVTLAAVLGIMLGIIIGFLLRYYFIISLPDIYYVETLPVTFNAFSIGLVFILVLLSGLCAVLIPIARIRNFSIVRILKSQEG